MARTLLTYEDLHQIPNDHNRYELVQGELTVNPAPSPGHQTAVVALVIILGDYCWRHDLGRVLTAPCDVRFTAVTVLEPDVLFVRREREAIIHELYIAGAPDLVVEVLSPSTADYDRRVKYGVYARYGVPNYWLVDPSDREIVALALEDGMYREVAHASGDAAFSAPPFPELAIPLPRLWR
jgi:Uma2 family endonuclease